MGQKYPEQAKGLSEALRVGSVTEERSCATQTSETAGASISLSI